MNPKPLQPDPTEVDVRAVRSVAYTLLHAKLSDRNCGSWDVANRRLHNLGRGLMEALGEGEDDARTKVLIELRRKMKSFSRCETVPFEAVEFWIDTLGIVLSKEST